MKLTHKQRAIMALNGETPDYAPTFELAFQLTEEAFGKSFHEGTQSDALPEKDRFHMCRENAELYLEIARRYDHSIIMVSQAPSSVFPQRGLGKYVIKHTDGNIMPVLDQIVDCGPHAVHSLDPQAHMDIAQVKRLYGRRVALCGNVNCGLLQTGAESEVLESCEYAMRHGKPGGRYIFCTSNSIFKGLPLERYELINRFWRKHRDY